MQLEQSSALRLPRWSTFLGDASYAIYLVHLLVLLVVLRPALLLYQHGYIPLPVSMLLLFVAAVCVGCAVHVIVERPMLQWFNRGKTPRPGERNTSLATGR